LLHFIILNPLAGKQPPPKRLAPPKEDVVEIVMPDIPEDKPDEVKELDDDPQENVLAPPSLVDVPTTVTVDSFVQPLAPPPPPSINTAQGAITIPVTRPGANFGRGLKDLFDINNLDQRPVARVQPQPTYPYEMSRAGINGEVVVEFIINTNGDVIQTQVVRSSHREFEAPAMAAVGKWKFKPGRKGGRAVNVRASQLIEFNLDDAK
jgi:protein TonB